jgi:hypothetical protein
VLLDANILLLLLAYRFDPQLIGGKRLEKYNVDDAELLLNYIEKFGRILTISSVLTEVSNLAGQMLTGRKKQALFTQMYVFFNSPNIEGVHHCSIHGIDLPTQTFVNLGYTDASIISIARAPHFLLTDDLDLFLDAQKNGIPAINFTHMREAYGLLG